MNIGVIGLGRMGNAIAKRVIKAGYKVFGFDVNQEACAQAADIGVLITSDVVELSGKADVVWLMLPAGSIIDGVLARIVPHLQKHVVLVDGGNSFFKDSIRRAKELQHDGFEYLDCGTSGGLRGAKIGFSLMIGGPCSAYETLIPLFKAIAHENGFGLVGPSGSGHYVKMVHNGIEYALLQAYAEGFHLIKDGFFKDEFLNLEQISNIWMHGSIVRSYILELAHDIFKKDQTFDMISGEIGQSGTGKWTVQEAHDWSIPTPTIEQALKVRSWSQTTGGNFATKLVAMLRKAFGGHAVIKE